MLKCFTSLLLLSTVLCVIERKEFSLKKGDTLIFDETVKSNPRSFDYDFDGDLMHAADKNDLYDELVHQLPKYNPYIRDIQEDSTEVPIVTRRWNRWNTWYTAVPTRGPFQIVATTRRPRVETRAPIILFKDDERLHILSQITPPPQERTQKQTTTTARPSPARTNDGDATPSLLKGRSRIRWTTISLSSTSRRATTRAMTAVTTTTTPKTAAPGKRPPGIPLHFPQPRPAFQPHHFPTVQGVRVPTVQGAVTPRPSTTSQREQKLTEDTTTLASTMPTTATNKSTVSYKGELHSEQRLFDSTRLPQHTRPLLAGRKTVAPKPVVIRLPTKEYKGPTFNCRILDPLVDAVPSNNHDSSCALVMPGFSKDGSCRCFYTITSRDDNGCAEGFTYACKPLWNKSVVV